MTGGGGGEDCSDDMVLLVTFRVKRRQPEFVSTAGSVPKLVPVINPEYTSE